MQRALMQCFKPENWFAVREALIQVGRADLIGSGCDCLIPAQPPREALEARSERNGAGRYARRPLPHPANPSKGEPPGERGLQQHGRKNGYRPGRKSQQRQKSGK
jgi:hypothetical protein